MKNSLKEANRQEKIKLLTDQIENGVLALRSSDDYARFLQFQAKLPSYSFRNCMLIMEQTQGTASCVMGYEAWKKLGRHVKKQERGIAILAPTPYEKKIKEKEVKEDGSIQENETTVKVLGYKVSYVYDVQQTEGKELPSLTERLKGDVKDYDQMMKAIEKISPVPISIEKIEGLANGYYSPSAKKIVIDADLDEKHKIHTAFHELGHAYLDVTGMDTDKERPEKEIEAESISFVLLNHALGSQITAEEAGKYSFGYVSSYSSDDSLKELKSLLSTIQRASYELIEKYDKALEETAQMSQADVRYYEGMLSAEEAERLVLAEDIASFLSGRGEKTSVQRVLEELTSPAYKESLEKIIELAKQNQADAVALRDRISSLAPSEKQTMTIMKIR